MKLEQYKLILITVGLIGALLIASPAITGLIPLPQSEHFSELYLLGPKHIAQGYPHNILPNQNYTVYLDVINHVGAPEYYVVYIMFLNASDAVPVVIPSTGSSAQVLYENRYLIQNEHAAERLLTFSISNTTVSNNQLTVGTLSINGQAVSVNKVAIWNSTISEYQYKLLFELFTYDTYSDAVQFDNRFIYLQLNCSSTT